MTNQVSEPGETPLVFEQFRSWTALSDILSAFRILENRTRLGDNPQGALSVRIPRDDKIGPVAQMMVLWLARMYRCPEVLLRLAADDDECVLAATVERIRTETFDGEYTQIEFSEGVFCSSPQDFESMTLKSAPHMIELIQRPVVALAGIIWRMVSEINPIRKIYKDEDVAPQLYLQTNSDSKLVAGIESCLRFAIGWPEGVCWAGNFRGGLVNGFRFNAFQGRPPFDAQLVAAARDANEELHRRLAPIVSET